MEQGKKEGRREGRKDEERRGRERRREKKQGRREGWREERRKREEKKNRKTFLLLPPHLILPFLNLTLSQFTRNWEEFLQPRWKSSTIETP